MHSRIDTATGRRVHQAKLVAIRDHCIMTRSRTHQIPPKQNARLETSYPIIRGRGAPCMPALTEHWGAV